MNQQQDVIFELHINDLSEDIMDTTAAMLGYLEVEAIEVQDHSLIVYHNLVTTIDRLEQDLLSLAPWLKPHQLSRHQRPNENWNQSWESSFDPIMIADFCTVKASFHDIEVSTPYCITIDPEMAFGTGHHETTYAMIEMMGTLDFSAKKILDFGTGTGILAILAEQLGAQHILAIDHDEIAIDCAQRCVLLNHCEEITCQTSLISDLPIQDQFDIVLANINRNVLIDNVQEIADRHVSGGVLILSGIMADDQTLILKTFSNVGYGLHNIIQRGEWLSIAMILDNLKSLDNIMQSS